MQTQADSAAAVALVERTALFDDAWYAEVAGRTFAGRHEAAAHYVETRGQAGPPHPLFDAGWRYPAEGWRATATDPLSHHLSGARRRSRSTHPLVDVDLVVARDLAAATAELGPVDHWLRTAAPDTPLPTTTGHLTLAEVYAAARGGLPTPSPPTGTPVTVLLLPPSAALAVAWLRDLDGTDTVVATADADLARLTRSVAASLRTSRAATPGDALDAVAGQVVVLLRPTAPPPSWPWLDELVAPLADPGVATTQALLLNSDRTVAAAGTTYLEHTAQPFLAGLPLADAERVGEVPLPAPWPGAVAFRTADVRRVPHAGLDERALALALTGRVQLAAGARLPAVIDPEIDPEIDPAGEPPAEVPAGSEAAWAAAGFTGLREPIRVREGRPALRWAIDLAAPAWPAGRRWGDLHFARSLADALADLGQWVALDHPETRGRASRRDDDVVLTIRGLDRVEPTPGPTRLLWVISHPDHVTAAECAAHDAVFAASTTWAARRTAEWGVAVEPLLQCTDPTRFHPGLAAPDSGPEWLFVGNSRGAERPAVRAAVEAGVPLTVYGAGWDGVVEVAGDHVDNADLGRLYGSAGVVLNDHWEDMRAAGFVSNRVFDVLATGARLLTDDVAGLHDLLPDVVTFTTTADLARVAAAPLDATFPDATARLALAQRVVEEHSFAARARTLLDAALRLRPQRRS